MSARNAGNLIRWQHRSSDRPTSAGQETATRPLITVTQIDGIVRNGHRRGDCAV